MGVGGREVDLTRRETHDNISLVRTGEKVETERRVGMKDEREGRESEIKMSEMGGGVGG